MICFHCGCHRNRHRIPQGHEVEAHLRIPMCFECGTCVFKPMPPGLVEAVAA